MPIQAICPHCHARYRSVPDSFLGKTTRCKRCQKTFPVSSVDMVQPHLVRETVSDENVDFGVEKGHGSPLTGTVMDSRIDQPGVGLEHKVVPQRTVLEAGGPQASQGVPGQTLAGPSQLDAPAAPHSERTVYGSLTFDGIRQAERESPVEWSVGDIILNMYRVKSILGEGAMGRVFLVRHLGWNLDLAVKTPKAEVLKLVGGAENFEKEAETWVNLGLHPHTVSCYYVRRLGGIPRVFAEFVDGGSLADTIHDQSLYQGKSKEVLSRMVDVAIQFAWGLHYAHEQGLIHQDVKPANVMVAPGWTMKVTDFGLARGKPVAGELKGGGTGTVMVGKVGMTPAYASPEQIAGQELTRRTDLWSFAVSILEMFSGEVTWPSGSIAPAVLDNYLQMGPTNQAIPRMPPPVIDLLKRCFQENPDKRPRSLLDVATELAQCYALIAGKDYSRPFPVAGKATADSLNNRGLSLIDLGQSDEALPCFDNALKVKPHHSEATYNRDLLQWRLGQLDDLDVLRDMEEIYRSHDDQEYAKLLVSQIQLERRDAVKALAILTDIHVSPEHETMVRDILEQARRRSGKAGGLMQTFVGYKSEFTKAYFKDSQHVVSFWADETVRIWDLRTGHIVKSINGAGRGIDRIFLSPDKNFFLATEAQSRFSFWDLRTGQVVAVWKGQTEFNRKAISITRDNRLVFTGEEDGSISLWDIRAGHRLKSLIGHTKPLRSLFLSNDERSLISGGDDTSIRIWDVGSGQCMQILEGHPYAIESLIVTKDGRQLISGCNQIKVWDLQRGQCLKTYDPQIGPVVALFLSPDDRYIIAGIGSIISRANVCRILEKDTGHVVRTFRIETFGIETATLSPDGRMILPTGYSVLNANPPYSLFQLGLEMEPYQAPFMLSRIQTSEELLKDEHLYNVELQAAMAIMKSGPPGVVAAHLRKARSIKGFERRKEAFALWQELYQLLPKKTLLGGWELATFKGHEKRVTSVRLTSDATRAVSASWDNTIRVWEIPSGRCIRTLTRDTAQELGISGLALGSDDKTLITCIKSIGTILWDIEKGPIRELEAVDSPTTPVISPDLNYWLSGSSHTGLHDKNTEIHLYNLRSGKRIMSYMGHADNVNAIALSADGRFVLSGGGAFDKTVKIWDLENKTVLRDFGRQTNDLDTSLFSLLSAVSSVCLGRQFKKALSGGDNGRINVWDIGTSQCLNTLEGHRGDITSIRMTWDERYALSSSFDSTLKVWDLQTGECLRTFSGHGDGIVDADMSLDGRYIVSAGADGLVKLWALDWALDDASSSLVVSDVQQILDVFLANHTPYQAELPDDYPPQEDVFKHAFHRRGTPSWTKEDVEKLMHQVRCFGFARFDSQTIVDRLEECAAAWTGPPAFPSERKPRLFMLPDGDWQRLPVDLFEENPPENAPSTAKTSSHGVYLDLVDQAKKALQNSDYGHVLESIDTARALHDTKFRPQALEILGKMYLHCPRRQWLGAWESTPPETIYETFYSGQISPDGRIAVTGSYPFSLRWWDLTTGRCIFKAKSSGEYIKNVIISPDNRYVYCCSKNQTEQWDMTTFERVKTFEGHEGNVEQIDLDESGRILASASWDGIFLWRTDDASIIRKLPIGENSAKSVCFTRDGRFLFSGHGHLHETMYQWDLASGKKVWTIANPRSIEKLRISPDNRFLFTATEFPTVWDISRRKEVQVFEIPHFQVTACTFTPCGRYILFNGFVFGESKTALYLYEFKSGNLVWKFSPYPLSITSLSFSRNARYLLLGCTMMGPGVFETTLKKWELEWQVRPTLPTELTQDAMPFLETFLTTRTPRAAELAVIDVPSEQEVTAFFSRTGTPTWNKADLKALQLQLASAGFGANKLTILNDELKNLVSGRDKVSGGKLPLNPGVRQSPAVDIASRAIIASASGPWRTVSVEPVYGQLTYTPLNTTRLSGSANGFRVRRADYPEIRFQDIRLVAVYRPKDDEKVPHVLIFTTLVSRPFLVFSNAVQYSDFPDVKAVHSLDSLRNLLNFIHRFNPDMIIDKRTEQFLSNETPVFVNARDNEIAAGLGAVFDSNQLSSQMNNVAMPLPMPTQPAVTQFEYSEETCPKCSARKESEIECLSCGLIYARHRPPRQQMAPPDDLMEIFENYKSRLNGKNIFAQPNIPLHKLENALNKYAAPARNEIILVLVDITVFGGAKDGLVLTDQALYAHDIASESFTFKINEIRDIRLEQAIVNYKLFVNKQQVLNAVIWDIQPQLVPLIEMIKKMSKLT